ncbi:MAG TPA: ABC transporter permease [Bdellovibrionales bacterium]|nr:ABC transporter permease [Bdellovibrionales bacterium]
MATIATTTQVPTKKAQRNSLWWDAFRRLKRNKIAMVSLAVIIVYVGIALGAWTGLLYPGVGIGDPNYQYQEFSSQHPFGTDVLGRDVLGRAVHGTATALSVGLIASGISLLIGIVLGAMAGYFGGKVDALIVWLYTTIDSIPYILLIPSLTFVLGRGLINVYIALGVTSWVTLCRLIRGEFIKHKNRDYVMAAEVLGAGHTRKMFRHILPNVTHLAFVQFGLGFVSAIKIEVILSYLGLGVDPRTPSWGIMLDDSKLELARPFWGNLTAATIFMFGLILSFNLFNEALRDALDPKLKNR